MALSAGALLALSASPASAAVSKVEAGSFGSFGVGAGKLGDGSQDIAIAHGGAGAAEPGDLYVNDTDNFRVVQFAPTETSADFVRAFGYDVTSEGEHNTGADERQTVTVKAGAGAFRLTLVTGTGSGRLEAGSNVVSDVETAFGSFNVGDAISTGGIPGGTTILSVGASTLTLSANATSSGNRYLTAREASTDIAFDASAAEVQEALEDLPGVGPGEIAVSGGPGDPDGTVPYVLDFAGGPFDGNDLAPVTGASGTPALSGGNAPNANQATVATTVAGGGPEVCETESTPEDICKQGVNAGGAAASFTGQLRGVAIDEATGNVFVADENNRRLAIFGADGTFQGAFGWKVDASNPQEELQLCTTATGCLQGTQGTGKGQFQTMVVPSVSPSGNLLVPARLSSQARVDEFSFTLNGSDEVTGVAFERRFGWDVKVGGSEEFEICLPADSCKAGVSGGGPGQFHTLVGVETDSAGNIYVLDAPSSCGAASVCRVQRFDPVSLAVADFAPTHLTRTSGSEKAVQIAIDPTTDHLSAVKSTASGLRLFEYDLAGEQLGEASPPLAAPEIQAANSLAVRDEGRAYVLQAALSRVAILGSAPPPEDVAMHEPVTGVTATEASFQGEFTIPAPGGPGFETRYRFEYFSSGNGWTPLPDAVGVNAGETAGTQTVELTATNLDPNTEYLVRLRACTGGCETSVPVEFQTLKEGPAIALTFSEDVTQTSATLGAQINPRGEATAYHFEWATEAEFEASGEYPRRVPAFERQIGAGSKAIVVGEEISGLSPESRYRFRVVATNPTDTATGPDQAFETLNGCGLINGRCFELVSEAEQGPVGEGGPAVVAGVKRQFQVAPDGSAVAYTMAHGLPETTTGGEVLYRGTRGEGSWSSTQLAVPKRVPSWTGNTSDSGLEIYLSEDLSCGFASSTEALTPDTPQAAVDAGLDSLYRIDPDGTYTLITEQAPIGSGSFSPFAIAGAAPDCGRVYFSSAFEYEDIDFSGSGQADHFGIYEWDEAGGLRNAGSVPASLSGEATAKPAVKGGAVAGSYQQRDWRNSVSADGTQLIFTAPRQRGDGPAGAAEVGKPGLFARRNGATTDISQSQTATPNQGAFYQYASEDGTKVFFLANAGLTAEPGNGKASEQCASANADAGAVVECDLYEYDFGKAPGARLENLSATADPANPKGAAVIGVLDGSDDGSRIYFAARGQLVGGEGNTYAKNLAGNGTYNLYLAKEGVLEFVASVPVSDLQGSNAGGTGILSAPRREDMIRAWSARATPSGGHLAFVSTGNPTGYESGGVPEAYRYEAASGGLDCVSCRRDGEPSAGTNRTTPLASRENGEYAAGNSANYHNPASSISADGSQVFFSMPDALASGAVEGNSNLYEWEEGQVALLDSRTSFIRFAGASEDGTSAFFATIGRLSPHDTDERHSVYVARVGGGFAAPTAPPVPCDPISESCRGAASDPGAATGAASSAFAGPGNEATAPKKSKKAKKKHKKAKGKKAKKKGKKKAKRGHRAGKDGRAAK